MKKIVIISTALIIISFKTFAFDLKATVDHSPVPLGEAFTLTLQADGKVDAMPELDVLTPQFKVYSTSVSRRQYVVNGQMQGTTEWQIGLIALDPDIRQIPPIKIGKFQSPALPIKIEAAQALPAEQKPNGNREKTNGSTVSQSKYTLQAEIAEPRPQYYVQQQILYHVIIHDNGGLEGGEPVFVPEQDGDWMIKSLGQPEISLSGQAGSQKRRIVFKYALFPQKSGKVKIPAVEFNGYSVEATDNANINVFGNSVFNIDFNLPSIFGIQKPVVLRAAAKELNILPVPENYSGKWWLPAQKVVLEAKWLKDSPVFKKGEAISREFTLKAIGAADNQLPDLVFPKQAELKQYPEKSVRRSYLLQNGIGSEQKTVNVYIPEQSGRLILPEVSIEWFNTVTGKIERAAVAAMPVFVEGASADQENQAAANGRQQFSNNDNRVIDEKTNAVGANSLTAVHSSQPENEPSNAANDPASQKASWQQRIRGASSFSLLLWGIAAFGLGMLAAWVLLIFTRRKGEKPLCEMRRYPDYIIQKAVQNDFRSLRDGLVAWATGHYPQYKIANLKDVATAAADPAFAQQIDLILAHLYDPQNTAGWNGKIFADAFHKVLKEEKKNKGKPSPLPPLYP